MYLLKLEAQLVTSTLSEKNLWWDSGLQNQNFDFGVSYILYARSIFSQRSHLLETLRKKIFLWKPCRSWELWQYTIGEKTVCVSALCYVIWTLYISEYTFKSPFWCYIAFQTDKNDVVRVVDIVSKLGYFRMRLS